MSIKWKATVSQLLFHWSSFKIRLNADVFLKSVTLALIHEHMNVNVTDVNIENFWFEVVRNTNIQVVHTTPTGVTPIQSMMLTHVTRVKRGAYTCYLLGLITL